MAEVTVFANPGCGGQGIARMEGGEYQIARCLCGWRVIFRSRQDAQTAVNRHRLEAQIRREEGEPLRFPTFVRDGEDWWPR